MRNRGLRGSSSELRVDDLQVESPRQGQVDKSFVNRGIESLSNCFKRKEKDLIRCQISGGLKLLTQEYGSLPHKRSRNFVKSDRQEEPTLTWPAARAA
jgi:hypothetical protein